MFDPRPPKSPTSTAARPTSTRPSAKAPAGPIWTKLAAGGIGFAVLSMVPPPEPLAPEQRTGAFFHNLLESVQPVMPYTPWVSAGLLLCSACAFGVRKRAVRRAAESKAVKDEKREPSALQNAASHALGVPANLVQVTIERAHIPRRNPQPIRNKGILSITVKWPGGRILDDPSVKLARALGTLMSVPMRPQHFDPYEGQARIVPGTISEPAEEEPEPEQIVRAATDPIERAQQILAKDIGVSQPEILNRDENGNPTRFRIYHRHTRKLAGEYQQSAAERALTSSMTPAPGGRGWGLTVNPQLDYVEVYDKDPLPNYILHPGVSDWKEMFGGRLYIPTATMDGGKWVGWDATRSGQTPHGLLVGSTGSGKTSTARSIIYGGTAAYQMEFLLIDPKRTEFMGYQKWPGVIGIATSITDMKHYVNAVWQEMMDRGSRVERYEVHPEDLPALCLYADELLIMRGMLVYHYRIELQQKGPIQELERLGEIAALGRSLGIHELLAIQRPDAELVGGNMRDNLGFRASHGTMSRDGATMVWGNPFIGSDPVSNVGRKYITGPNGAPVEAQSWWSPNPDANPMYWNRLSEEEKSLVQALRPAPWATHSLTKKGLVLPPPTTPAPGGLESMGIKDSRVARQLQPGMAVLLEDSEGGLTRAVVEQVERVGDRVELSVIWDGGQGGTVSMDDGEIVCLV